MSGLPLPWWLSILPLLAAGETSDGPKRLIVSSIESGTLIWHGHRLDPPYRLSVEYRLEPDTVWGQTYVNDLPLHPRRPALTGPEVPPSAFVVRFHALTESVFAVARRDRQRGCSDSEMLEHAREILVGATDVVDSVSVRGTLSLDVWWKGWKGYPHSIGLNWSPRESGKFPPAPLSTSQSIARALERGLLVIIGGGIAYIPNVRLYLGECDALRSGKPIEGSIIKDRHAAADCAHPKPIEVLLREGE